MSSTPTGRRRASSTRPTTTSTTRLYLFSEAARVTLAPGDRHRMTCTFDNSPANQPLVNGERKISVDVSWGDASTDEMCQNALLRVASLK